jgi:hypothetical protein
MMRKLPYKLIELKVHYRISDTNKTPDFVMRTTMPAFSPVSSESRDITKFFSQSKRDGVNFSWRFKSRLSGL